jgi:hypothetical protein
MLLASNQSVLSLGELFNPTEEIRRMSYKAGKEVARSEDPIEYLETTIFQKYSEDVKAVGFKLFYLQARDDSWKAVWDYIRDSDLRIIHMKRKNLLDRYLSHQLAEKSGVWIHLKKGNEETNESIILNASDCAKNFHKSEFWQKQVDEFFQNNRKTILFYEDLCKYPKGESRRIQDFLSLKPQELASITEKQRTKKKSEVITNLDDLKRQFIRGVSEGWARKEWIDFFDET